MKLSEQEQQELKPEFVRHVDTIMLTDHAIDAALVHRELYGAGLSGRPVEKVEYHVYSTATFNHFMEYILSPNFAETLKMTARNVKSGKQFALLEQRHELPKVQGRRDARGSQAAAAEGLRQAARGSDVH